MYDLFIYSLKAGACLAVFYLFFKLLLSRETLHRFNRLLVLSGMVLAFALPLCVITVYRELPVVPVTVSDTVPVLTPAVPQEAAFDWRSAVGGVFFAGVAVMLLRTLCSLFGVLRIVRSGSCERLGDGTVLVRAPQAAAPFSWGRFIVVPAGGPVDCEREILVHERAHVRLHHSADLLLTDLAGAFQWFNPAMWLLRRELRAIHEYEADKAVIDSGADPRDYQLLLIKKAVGGRWYSVANSFNHSKLKNRITMMLRKKSSRWTGVKALFVLPLTAVALGAFARTAYVVPDDKVSKESVTASVSGPNISLDGFDGQPLYLVDGQEVASLDGIPSEKIASISVLKDGQAVETYGDRARHGVISVTLKKEGDVVVFRYGKDSVPSGPAPLYIVDGQEAEADCLNRIDPDRIASIDVYKDAETLAAYGEKGRNGVAVITLKKEGSAKADKRSVPINAAPIVVRGFSDGGSVGTSKTAWFVDGRQVEHIDDAADASDIQTVTLLKQVPAELKAQGFDAVALVRTKKAAAIDAYFDSDEWKEAQKKMTEAGAYFKSDEWKAAMQSLTEAGLQIAEDVERYENGSLSASSGDSEQYRGQGCDEVGVITTQRAGSADRDWGISTSDRNSVWTHDGSVTQAKGSITITGMEQVPDDCLIFIDGKRSAKADMAGIPSGKIRRMNIYKGEKAVEKFGPEARSGAIEIKTRKR